MKRLMLVLLALWLPGVATSLPLQEEPMARADSRKSINLDVACDCRTFSFNSGVPDTGPARGDGFIVNGKIFRGGTLPPGAASNDPNDPGSIGDWICRGTITGAVEPPAFITQYHLLTAGERLVSEGAASNVAGQFAVVGGTGSFSGASGEMSAVEIGTNITGCPNIRFTINLKKQAPK